MSRLLCCRRARQPDMGVALSHLQEGEACDGGSVPAAPPTMADVIRERKKKTGGAGLGTLRRRIAAATRRPRDSRPDRGCEHARYIRGVVSGWRVAEVFLLCEELEAAAALRDLTTRAELARPPAPQLAADLCAHRLVQPDLQLSAAAWVLPVHRCILAARSAAARHALRHAPPDAFRIPAEGALARLSAAEANALVMAMYSGSPSQKWSSSCEDNLDIISSDHTNNLTNSCEHVDVRRLAEMFGCTISALHRDIRYLLDSGEHADAVLTWRCGASLPCHRVILAARSRFFRNLMTRHSNSTPPYKICVDESVLPRRFAQALLHAAYTDQVDLSLISRSSSSPSSTNSSNSSMVWPGVGKSSTSNSARVTTMTILEDAFQLYEIARFVEMPIAVQGCEDAIVEALSAETLPRVLRWASAPHASRWVHRQALRYLRDEFTTVMASASSAQLPASALAAALASPFVQCSEQQALRALLRWAEREQALHSREPNVIWHTSHSASRRGGRRREVSDAAVREALSTLIPLVNVEQLPREHELVQQAIRRGILPAPAAPAADDSGSTAHLWLGRGPSRPPRCFLPYLDEIKALLEDQEVPEAELARLRRNRYIHRIPDTLYMVSNVPESGTSNSEGGGELSCVSPRTVRALRVRMRELTAHTAALCAHTLQPHHQPLVRTQLALRAVRERGLPDSCAELLISEVSDSSDRERSSGEWESARGSDTQRSCADDIAEHYCRSSGGSGSVRCSSAGSLHSNTLPNIDMIRTNSCGRELPSRPTDTNSRRSCGDGSGRGRLSAVVPDVAMAPNANTHLLTAAHYAPRHAHWEFNGGGGLQLDLGDGATHTPRPGSRAQRAAAQNNRQLREAAQCSTSRPRPEDDDVRTAIELSVIRAYSGSHPSQLPQQSQQQTRRPLTRLHADFGSLPRVVHSTGRGVSASSPPLLSLSRSHSPHAHSARLTPSPHHVLSGQAGAVPRRSGHSPRRLRADYPLYTHRARHYRLESYGGASDAASRGQSPNDYA